MPKKNRHKTSVDIDPELDKIITKLAKDHKTTKSQIINLFIAEGLISVVKEDSSFWGRLVPSSSRGYQSNVDIQDLIDWLKDNS